MPVGSNRIHFVYLFEVIEGVLLYQNLLVVETTEVYRREKCFFSSTDVNMMRKLTALTQLRFHYHWEIHTFKDGFYYLRRNWKVVIMDNKPRSAEYLAQMTW